MTATAPFTDEVQTDVAAKAETAPGLDTKPAQQPSLTHASLAYSSWLHRLSVAFVVVTFILVTSGGLVTSYDAGMSVPDWPASFGKFLLLPIHIWSDMAVFLEHNHRLTGMVSGLMSIALVAGCGKVYGFKTKPAALAGFVLAAFIIQGIFGGFRVVLETWFGEHGVYEPARVLRVVHGVTGQLVLGLTVWLTAVVGPWHHQQNSGQAQSTPAHQRGVQPIGRAIVAVFFLLLTLQLTLGATVRHYQAASAIPDAPFVYGGLVPPLDPAQREIQFEQLGGTQWELYAEEPAAQIEAVDGTQSPDLLASTPKIYASSPTTPMVLIHYGHRLGAMIVLPIALMAVLLGLAVSANSLQGLVTPIALLISFFVVQVLLGMGVIFSREEPWVASAHQSVGAILMGLTVWLLFRVFRSRTALT